MLQVINRRIPLEEQGDPKKLKKRFDASDLERRFAANAADYALLTLPAPERAHVAARRDRALTPASAWACRVSAAQRPAGALVERFDIEPYSDFSAK